MPNSPEVYVHRIGRTGRVGRSGRAITLVTPKQQKDLEAVRKHANTEIALWTENGKAAAAAAPVAVAPAVESVPPAQEPPVRAAEEEIVPVATGTNGGDPEAPAAEVAEAPQPRRPRHTKPRRSPSEPRTKLLVGAGRARGLEPADVVAAIVDNSHLDGEDVSNVRVLERFSFVEVPGERAGEVVDKVNGQSVRGVELRLEVASR
jgi:ATP-dependent RNA helicase DeaD